MNCINWASPKLVLTRMQNADATSTCFMLLCMPPNRFFAFCFNLFFLRSKWIKENRILNQNIGCDRYLRWGEPVSLQQTGIFFLLFRVRASPSRFSLYVCSCNCVNNNDMLHRSSFVTDSVRWQVESTPTVQLKCHYLCLLFRKMFYCIMACTGPHMCI